MIDILMATYNGGKFIEVQIHSIINQTYTDWKLLIHDDGSSDSTIEIIRKFEIIDSRINVVQDGKTGLGTAQNFLHLLKHSTADYLIFCDQDDIWLESKLSEMLDEILNRDNTTPCAVYSNAFVYQESDLTIQGHATLATPTTLKDLLFLNAGIQGCSILFNKQLKNICLNTPEKVCMHDHLLTLAAVTFGEFSYIDKRLMIYRRHTDTVTGNTTSSKLKKIYDFFDRKKTVLDKIHFEAVSSFYLNYYDSISTDDKNTFKEYLAFPEKNIISRIIVVIKHKFKIFDSILLLLIKVILRKAI